MTLVQMDANNLQWPSMCCRCGAPKFTIKPLSEKVVLWTTLGVTKYQQITINIPVCQRCSIAHLYWYGAAAACVAPGLLPLSVWNKFPNALPFLFVLATVLAFIGSRRRPLRIKKLDEKTNKLSVEIYEEKVALAIKTANAGKARKSGA